jgi:putative spermidine/putrescine transport system ATP-binding protein
MMATNRGHRLTLDNITQRFSDFTAVRDISLDVAGGELVALLGPSGCGKSTLLRIMSGFIRQTEGRVLFDGQPVDHLSPSQRGVGIVFQNYALFPHMTVAENVAYGLHMSEFARRKPRQLSGGQQQRIALARCLAIDPKILLLDEPFGALDKNLRLDMQIEVKRLQRESGVTTILVTHDQEEALSMADRVAVMSRGSIEQVSTPTEIYDRPKTLFVNQFVGATNVLSGEFAGSGLAGRVTLAGGAAIDVPAVPGIANGSTVTLSIRPEQLHIAPGGELAGIVKAVMPLGAHVVYEIEIASGISLRVSEPREGHSALRQTGEQVNIAPASPDACHVFPATGSHQGV